MTDKVRFVGDPIAVVVAETAMQAKDAAEAVEVDIEPLPAVTRASDAAKPGAPQLYDDVPDNVALDYLYGDPDKVAEAFSKAAHVTKLDLVNSRVVVSAMEPRVGDRVVRQDERPLHDEHRLPGRLRHEGRPRRYSRRHARQGACARRQCRRLVRHEGRGLSRIRADPACRQGTGPAGEMDRGPLRELRLGPSRPRPRIRRRACARREGQIPRGALPRLTATPAPISARSRR